jgi:hypothetical protein
MGKLALLSPFHPIQQATDKQHFCILVLQQIISTHFYLLKQLAEYNGFDQNKLLSKRIKWGKKRHKITSVVNKRFKANCLTENQHPAANPMNFDLSVL